MSERDYISQSGFDALQTELEQLYRIERPRVVANVAAAAPKEIEARTLSIFTEKALTEIDRRIEFLTKRVDALQIVAPPKDLHTIRFLSSVTVSDDTGRNERLRLLGQMRRILSAAGSAGSHRLGGL